MAIFTFRKSCPLGTLKCLEKLHQISHRRALRISNVEPARSDTDLQTAGKIEPGEAAKAETCVEVISGSGCNLRLRGERTDNVGRAIWVSGAGEMRGMDDNGIEFQRLANLRSAMRDCSVGLIRRVQSEHLGSLAP